MAGVDEIVRFGPFFAGNAGPPVELICLYDAGGYVPLTGGAITVTVRRWDPRRAVAVGAVVTEGEAQIVDAAHGNAIFDWTQATLGNVPDDPGIYVLQVSYLPGSLLDQDSQRAVFEVLPALAPSG